MAIKNPRQLSRTRLVVLLAIIAIAIGLVLQPLPVHASAFAPMSTTRADDDGGARILPPPVLKPNPNGNYNGRTDLSNPYEAGAIKLKVKPGLSVAQVLANHGVAGIITPLSPPPYDKWDHAVGTDRSFKVTVALGLEKVLVSTLAQFTNEIEWVNMYWLPNGRGGLLAPNDTLYVTGQQPYLSWIGMERAWDKTVSFSGVIVAPLDSGLYAGHEDAGVSKQYAGWDYLVGAAMPAGQATDSGCAYGHGTKVSTIAAADTNNGRGIAGTGFNSGLMPMKVLRADCQYGAMSNGSITYDWPIRYARSQGAHIINMSYDIGTYLPPEMQDALTAAWSGGSTPVAAAGNGGSDHRAVNRYPCDASYVVCVGGVDNSTGHKWISSDFGSPFVDVMAPSVSILAATNQASNDYRTDNGTSYASPMTAGVLALLRSLGYAPQQQFDAIAATAQYPPGTSDPNGWSTYGLINAGAALWH